MNVKDPIAARILAIVLWLIEKAYGINLQPKPKVEINFMITIADNTPDGTVTAALGEVRDDEGALIPAALQDPTADNPSAFAFTTITNDGKNLSAGFHVGGPKEDGSPDTSTVKFNVVRTDTGEVIDTFSEVIKVTSGKASGVPLTVDLSGIGPVDPTPDTTPATPAA